uniref:IP13630p n=1 Tax=Drosophila melanogaster TaxID=7227 RepID=Q1LZ44_DROME|nr:IP13630p [Drosophila melanogaster]
MEVKSQEQSSSRDPKLQYRSIFSHGWATSTRIALKYFQVPMYEMVVSPPWSHRPISSEKFVLVRPMRSTLLSSAWLRLQIVIAGNGMLLVSFCLALVEMIMGEALHFTYTLDMKNTERITTSTKARPKKMLKGDIKYEFVRDLCDRLIDSATLLTYRSGMVMLSSAMYFNPWRVLFLR